MNIQEYIESGILESYVFGGATDQERQEVECMSKIYPEIKDVLSTFEMDLERMSSSISVTPPAAMRASILDAIEGVDQLQGEDSKEGIQQETKVIPLPTAKEEKQRGGGVMRLLVAASVVAAIAFAGLFWQQREASIALNTEIETNKLQLAEMQGQIEQISADRATADAQLAFVQDPATQKIAMPGTDLDKLAKTTAYYNPALGKVQLAVNKLAQLPSEKQYQLWAIVEGVPVDMGVLEIASNTQDLIVVETAISDAQAFAITIEKAGGSATPSLDQMVVVGNVAV